MKELKKSLNYLSKDKGIFDVIVYGSLLKGRERPRDIDILVIFVGGTLRERLERIQKIKSKMKVNNADIKQALLTDLCEYEGRQNQELRIFLLNQ